MNTFRCSNCGFQIQRPTQPFSCPQCGRQAVGLFRLVSFTPPAQGGWPGQPAQPGMQPGMPQQAAWPQQPACRSNRCRNGHAQQPGMPQHRECRQPVPGGWPAQPQVAAAAGQSLGTTARRAADAATAGRRWLARQPQQPACRSSRGCRSSPVCRSREDGPRNRRFRSRRPIPGANSPACRRCRNSRPPVVGPASRACPSRSNRACRSNRAFPSRACRRRRRPGRRHAIAGRATAPGSRRWGSQECRSRVHTAGHTRRRRGINRACRRAIRSRLPPRCRNRRRFPSRPPGIPAACARDHNRRSRRNRSRGCPQLPGAAARDIAGPHGFSAAPGAVKRPAAAAIADLPSPRRRSLRSRVQRSFASRQLPAARVRPLQPESPQPASRTSTASPAAQSLRRRVPAGRPNRVVRRPRNRGLRRTVRAVAGEAARRTRPASGPAAAPAAPKPPARPKPPRPESLVWSFPEDLLPEEQAIPLRNAPGGRCRRPRLPPVPGPPRGPGRRRQEAEAALGVCHRQPCPRAGRARSARYAPPALLRRLSALPRRGHRQAGLVAGQRRRAVGLCRAGDGSRRQHLGQFARRRAGAGRLPGADPEAALLPFPAEVRLAGRRCRRRAVCRLGTRLPVCHRYPRRSRHESVEPCDRSGLCGSRPLRAPGHARQGRSLSPGRTSAFTASRPPARWPGKRRCRARFSARR